MCVYHIIGKLGMAAKQCHLMTHSNKLSDSAIFAVTMAFPLRARACGRPQFYFLPDSQNIIHTMVISSTWCSMLFIAMNRPYKSLVAVIKHPLQGP